MPRNPTWRCGTWIKTFPNARVSWSINALDKSFRREMDGAASIERRLAAMKAFYDAGVRTTCFISPIFPGITDIPAIVRRVKEQRNLIWTGKPQSARRL